LLYLGTALVMVLFFSASLIFSRNNAPRFSLGHSLYELGAGITGMTIALIRVLLLDEAIFRIPTIYVAVLYGIAVIFLYHYLQSLVLYLVMVIASILLIPLFHPLIEASSYRADIISNAALAWLLSAMNYRSFIKDFENRKLIQAQNKELLKKNNQIQRANRDLTELSIRDGLTELYNRRKMDADLKKAQARALRYASDFAVIILDIDHFKKINDSHGHETGDEALKGVSRVLVQTIRETDAAARWGGEEFLVLCPETDLAQARLLAERLRENIAQEEYVGSLRMTASFGVASHLEFSDLKDLLNAADNRLYTAKGQGRNRVEAGPLAGKENTRTE
jgi:diguanylate cyclase (GGDEF)-like protein